MLKNACIFIAEKGKLNFDLAELNDLLAAKECPECGPVVHSVDGFVQPVKGSDFAIDVGHGLIALMYQRVERMLPAGVVNAELAKRVDKIEEAQARKVYRKERMQLKDEIILELLPRAFTKASRNLVVIDTEQSRVFVDAASHARAEEALSTLRKAIGSLPIVPISNEHDLGPSLTYWAAGAGPIPDGITLGERCELTDSGRDGKSIARFINVWAASDDIGEHLANGWDVSKVEIKFCDELELYLSPCLTLKRIKMLDCLLDKVSFSEPESELAEFVTTLFLQMSTLRKLFDVLIKG